MLLISFQFAAQLKKIYYVRIFYMAVIIPIKSYKLDIMLRLAV